MMKVLKLLLLSSWILLQVSSSFAQTDYLQQNLPKINQTLREAGNVPCLKCGVSENNETTTVQHSKKNTSRIEVSVVSLSRAQDIFKQLSENEDIPHRFVMEGCFARAHAMVQQMDEMGLISAKAYVEGDLQIDGGKFGPVRWSYHVAPMLMVKTPKGIIPYIFDPSLFKGPVPFEEWKALMLKNPKSKYTGEYYTSRFNYNPDTRHAKFTDYREEDLEHAREVNRNFLRALDMMDYEEKAVKNKGKIKVKK